MSIRREDGASTIELAWVLPLLLLILVAVAPILKAGWEYMTLNRAMAHTVRFATRVDPNARCDGTVDSSGMCSGTLRRRPTAAEVDAFAREAAGAITLGTVEVTPEPVGTVSGELITVRATYEFSFGPFAALANAVSGGLLGGGELLPASRTVTVTAQGRQE